jgi:hypothetical protein
MAILATKGHYRETALRLQLPIFVSMSLHLEAGEAGI